MKKNILILLMLCIVILLAAQSNELPQTPTGKKSNITWQVKRAQRMTVGGAVVVGSTPVFVGVGLGVLYGSSNPNNGRAAIVGVTITELSIPVFIAGIPVLVAGLVLRNALKRIKSNVSLNGVVLPDGESGLALNF